MPGPTEAVTRAIKINPQLERAHWHEAIRRVAEAFTSGKRRALLVMATGTGKTRTTMGLVDLFLQTSHKTSVSYHELLQFTARFRFYSPFNAMLIHVQMPGAKFVAPAHRWAEKYRRNIKPGARPLVILQPMGPVLFVFDVADTEPRPNAPPLPRDVENPFEVLHGWIDDAP